MRLLATLLDRVLGPKCDRCRQTRVLPADVLAHSKDCS